MQIGDMLDTVPVVDILIAASGVLADHVGEIVLVLFAWWLMERALAWADHAFTKPDTDWLEMTVEDSEWIDKQAAKDEMWDRRKRLYKRYRENKYGKPKPKRKRRRQRDIW